MMADFAALVGPYPFDSSFMIRALIAATAIGICAPLVGTFVVQRKLALIGDGLGHVAAAGVGIALWLDRTPQLVAIVLTVIAACVIEWVIKFVKNPDSALALIFYSGIAASITFAGRGSRQNELQQYLFGSLLSINEADVKTVLIVSLVISLIIILLSKVLLAIAIDESSAKISGVPTGLVRIILMICVALIVSVSMTITGLLLISAVMVIPVLSARLITKSFRSSWVLSMVIGVTGSVGGLALARIVDSAPGGTIVLAHVGIFILLSLWRSVLPLYAKRTLEDSKRN